ncbi:MAG: cbb3-type cytochrome c oxidase subunit 3 [Hyphomicrobiaceae bacterium]|nr:cbb3-type cytochrome c oxidase subunit 3 [Hyphomicrobiaceae bacterium]
MTYQTVAFVSQITAMALFTLLFAGVLVYALWPGNKQKFDRAARLPLEGDEQNTRTGGRHG